MNEAIAGGGGYTPYQLGLINRMNAGGYDYTFGPGSPGATREDLQTYVGGKYSPAGGFARHGGWALAPKDYYSFSPSQRRSLGIMDIAPRNQAGQLERYFAAGRKGFGGGGYGGAGGRGDRAEPGSSGGYIGLGEPSRYGGGYNQPSWGQEGFGGDVEIGGGGRFGQGVYTGYVDSAGRPTSDPYGAARATPAGQLSGSDIRDTIGQDYSGNLQASTNPLDYLNPFGGTSKGGSGTGAPTQRAVGQIVGTASNLLLPGLGFITGPLARYATNLIQHGATKQQAAAAVQQKQQETAMPHGSVSLPRQGGGGNDAGYSSPDYLRSIGYREGQGTGSLWPGGGGLGGAGGGGGSFYGGNLAPHWASTAIGFGGNLGGSGPVNAGAYMRNAGLNRPFSAQEYGNLGANMKYPAPAIANAWGGMTQRPDYQQYLAAWHPSGGGGRGMRQRQPGAMAHTPRLSAFAEGSEDVVAGISARDMEGFPNRKLYGGAT